MELARLLSLFLLEVRSSIIRRINSYNTGLIKSVLACNTERVHPGGDLPPVTPPSRPRPHSTLCCRCIILK
jgi:hypothetical protein